MPSKPGVGFGRAAREEAWGGQSPAGARAPLCARAGLAATQQDADSGIKQQAGCGILGEQRGPASPGSLMETAEPRGLFEAMAHSQGRLQTSHEVGGEANPWDERSPAGASPKPSPCPRWLGGLGAGAAEAPQAASAPTAGRAAPGVGVPCGGRGFDYFSEA